MISDIYSLYSGNERKLGFWIKKNNWDNYLARIVKFSGVQEGEELGKVKKPAVIAFLLDTRTNEIEDCVELSNPSDPAFIQVHRDIEPKNILPPKLDEMARTNFPSHD